LRRGAALVEFAMVVPILIFMILGIMEFGWYAKNQLTVANATREGARQASLGRTTGDIETRVRNSAAPVTINEVELRYSDESGTNFTNTLGNRTLANGSSENNAPPGRMVRVAVKAAHRSLTSLSLFGSEIRVTVIMVRERN
jgi:Flp pilus assembly protein TadG